MLSTEKGQPVFKKGTCMAVKTFRKGQAIFEEGDTLDKYYIVQTGSVQVGLRKDKKFVDFFAVGPNGFLGEYGLLGHAQHLFTAVCRSETQVLEIPKLAMKEEINAVPGFVKVLIKSALERLKISNQALRSLQSPDQLSMFPEERIPTLFAAAYYIIREKSTEHKGTWTVDFRVFKNQMQRVFGLGVAEVLHFCHVLWRLKILSTEAQINKIKDWNPVEQVTFTNLDTFRFFFDFYQYYYFKSGRDDVLKIDMSLFGVMEEIETLHKEGNGVPLPELETRVAKRLKFPLNPDHFVRLEKKGIFIQRVGNGADSRVECDWKELNNILWAWRFLQFFDLANANGTVDFEIELTKPVDENACPTCKTETTPAMKFCSNCGGALAVKKAA